MSDRSGANELWQIEAAASKATAEPQPVKSNMGAVYYLGSTRNGSLFFEDARWLTNINIASVDWTTGAFTTPPKRINSRHIGTSSMPLWSPDGERLAFLSGTTPEERAFPSTLTVCSIKDNKQTEFRLNEGLSPYNLGWSKDGKYIYARTRTCNWSGLMLRREKQ